MIKREELTNPNSCMYRARDNEMTFVLLGRDEASAETIRFWVKKRIELGKNVATDLQIVEALDCAKKMELEYRFCKTNKRRLELAEKKSVGDLSPDEREEFNRLLLKLEEYLNSKFPRIIPDFEKLRQI